MQLSLLMPMLAALASAQSTTVVSIFEGGANDTSGGVTFSMAKSLGGSVVGINADYTTYEVECMSGAATSDCSVDEPYTLLAGPTTLSYSRPLPISVYGTTVTVDQDVHCSFTHTSESAVCTDTQSMSLDGQSTSTVLTTSIPSKDVFYYPITITAGVSKFNSPQATQAPNAAARAHHPVVTAAPLGAAAALAAAALL